MEADVSCRVFFSDNMPPVFSRLLVMRTAKQLCRDKVEMMSELAARSYKQLERKRNIGEKSMEVIRYMRELYITGKT